MGDVDEFTQSAEDEEPHVPEMDEPLEHDSEEARYALMMENLDSSGDGKLSVQELFDTPNEDEKPTEQELKYFHEQFPSVDLKETVLSAWMSWEAWKLSC